MNAALLQQFFMRQPSLFDIVFPPNFAQQSAARQKEVVRKKKKQKQCSKSMLRKLQHQKKVISTHLRLVARSSTIDKYNLCAAINKTGYKQIVHSTYVNVYLQNGHIHLKAHVSMEYITIALQKCLKFPERWLSDMVIERLRLPTGGALVTGRKNDVIFSRIFPGYQFSVAVFDR